jgi:hypothetical protein
MAKQILTAARAHELLVHDEDAGVLRWKVKRGNHINAGDVAGPPGSMRGGYLRVYVEGKTYSVHRVVWLMHFGVHATGEIDHIDGNKANNRMCNLRDVPRTQNQENLKRAHKDNGTGLLGVSFHKKNRKFTAHITIAGKAKYLGSYLTANAAHQAYLEEKRKAHRGCTI